MLSASQTATQPTNPISQSSRERRLSPSIVWPAAARLRSSRNPGCSPKALEVTVILSALLSEEFAGALRCRRFVWTRVGEAASVVDSPTRGGTALIHRRCWHGLPPYERPWSMRRARDAETDADAPTRTGLRYNQKNRTMSGVQFGRFSRRRCAFRAPAACFTGGGYLPGRTRYA